jgi:hypothetical protein
MRNEILLRFYSVVDKQSLLLGSEFWTSGKADESGFKRHR